MADARILVITPTLGESEFLQQSRESVARLGAQALHVLSCPANRVAALASRFPECIVVPDAGREGGIYGALNTGIKAAPDGWDWFTYINDDDALGPDFAAMYSLHTSGDAPAAVGYGDVRLINEKSEPIGHVTTERNPRYIGFMLHQIISPMNQQGMVFSRALVNELGGFDLRYKLCADLDFWARAYAAGHEFKYYPMEVGQFRVRRGQLSGDVMLTRREFGDIVSRHLPSRPPAIALTFARCRYRLMNLPRYLARLRRVGWKTSEEVLSGGG